MPIDTTKPSETNLVDWFLEKLDYKQDQEPIKSNQQEIILLSKSTNQITINPIYRQGGGGNVEHYFHFIFDLLLPLSLLIKRTPSTVVFSIQEFGILTPLLKRIFGDRVAIFLADNKKHTTTHIDLVGMNPDLTEVKPFQFKVLKKLVYQNLKISKPQKATKIILVERIAPDSYYINNAHNKGSGTTRRSIRNHKELEKILREKVNQKYEFCNIALEEMTFEDQVECFSNAAIVIAQHGAGLSNIMWMAKKSIVIEFGYKSKTHFQNLSKLMNHKFFLLDYNKSHINVNCNEFTNWLIENETTTKFFA